MEDIAIVAARSQNNVIGCGVKIPWHVKGEQKLFKQITLGGTLIMGRRTFEGMGRPLPGRETIIITRNFNYVQGGCAIATDPTHAMQMAATLKRPIYVAGGGEIYQQMLSLAQYLHLTTIQAHIRGDVFFPRFNEEDYYLLEEEHFESNINYTYQKLKRKV